MNLRDSAPILSTLGLGCMRLSTEANRDDARGLALLTDAIISGATLFDTADSYCLDDEDVGHNERLLEDAIEHASTRLAHSDAAAKLFNESICIVTKGGLTRPDGTWVPDGRAKHLGAAARASADRLGRAPDVYLLHTIDPRTDLATSVRALRQVRDDGVVRAVGVSNVTVSQIEVARGILGTVGAVENELSPYHLDSIRGGVVRHCEEYRIPFYAYRPFGGPKGVARLMRDPVVTSHAERLALHPLQLVLAWLRIQSEMIVPLPGTTSIEHVPLLLSRKALDEEASIALSSHFLEISRAAHVVGSDLESKYADTPPAGFSKPAPQSLEEIEPPRDTEEFAAVEPAPARQHARAVREVVIVMGMPGAGKSTHAKGYTDDGYVRLNRDERGGTLKDLAKELAGLLDDGTSHVVLDNTYPTRASRNLVIGVAHRYDVPVRCVLLDTAIELAQKNAVLRMLARHGRLLMPDELHGDDIGPGAQFRWRREYEAPIVGEGFSTVETVSMEARTGLVDPARNKALLVELDDVVWRGRPTSPAEIVVHPQIRERLREWHADGLVIAATSWQPNATPAQFAATVDALRARLDIPLLAMACHHPAGPPVCWCRKPLPGMGLYLAHANKLEIERVIGNGAADRGFALRMGVPFLDLEVGTA